MAGAFHGTSSDETAPPLREIDGWICTTCRQIYARSEVDPGAVSRCVRDGGVLVDTRAFAEAGEDQMLGRLVAGRFTVLAKLGAGSMGTVYRARQEAMGRDVALKILRQERSFDANAKARFEREARANSVLVSAHTVTVFDFGVAEDGSLYLAMELLEGESISSRLRRAGKLPARDAARIAREALTSLAEAHHKGIIHRDIKPDNVFLARVPTPAGGTVEITKVLDFGIAKVMRDEGRVDALETQAGTVFGTPRYMSPEQAQGKPLDARSDLYSLGVILFQMLAGKPPFEDEDAVVVMARHIKSPPPSFREVAPDADVSEPLEAVVDMALAKEPADRPATADEFIRLLDEAIALHPVDGSGVRRALGTVPPGVLSTRLLKRRKASPISIGFGVAAALLVGAAILWAVGTRRASDTSSRTASAPSASASATVATPEASASATIEVPLDALPPAEPPPSKHAPKATRAAAPPKPPPPPPAETSKPASKYGKFE